MEDFTQNAKISEWVESVCGVTDGTIQSWTAYFVRKNLFGAVRKDLDEYCDAPRETSRYEPLTKIFTKILKIAQDSCGEMSGIKGLPPLDDLRFVSHDSKVMQRQEHQGKLAAMRKPDIVAVRDKDYKNACTAGKSLDWFAAVIAFELKYENNLRPQLDAERKKTWRSASTSTSQAGNDSQILGVGSAERASLPQAHALAEQADSIADFAADTDELQVSETASTGSKRRARSQGSSSSHTSKKARSSGPPAIDSYDTTAKVQLGGYALEMMGSTLGTRMHVLGVIVRDDLVSLWYFDASGVVCTCSRESGEKLSLINDLERVAAIIVALSYCSPERLGAPPQDIIQPPKDSLFPGSFPLQSLAGCSIDLTTSGDKCRFLVTLSKHIYTQYLLIGRRSGVYTATVHEEAMIGGTANEEATNGEAAKEETLNDGQEVVVKLSQQPPGRTSEAELIQQAKDAGVEHLPEIIKFKDLWELRTENSIREAFGLDVDNRVLRCIVTPRYTPLSAQLRKNPDSLVEMAKQMIACIDDLRYKANILHRDISEGNIMYTQTKDGKDWFILIDFDLGVKVTKEGFPLGPSARHRTGTLPFMAFELVESIGSEVSPEKPVRHCVRHDFESLLWVSLWCAVCIVDPRSLSDDDASQKQARATFLATLEKGDSETMASRKMKLLTNPDQFMAIPLSPAFKHLHIWLSYFLQPFFKYIITAMQQRQLSFFEAQIHALSGGKAQEQTDETVLSDFALYETGHGHVTRNALLEAVGLYEKLQNSIKPAPLRDGDNNARDDFGEGKVQDEAS